MEPSGSIQSDQLWVIGHYLNGTLPDDLHQQVEQRRQTDPLFNKKVLAMSLLNWYAESERDRLAFYAELEPLMVELAHKQSVYETTKVIQFLPQLLLGVAAMLLLVMVWMGGQPTARHMSRTTVTDPNELGYGIDDAIDSVVVVVYEHSPGIWRYREQYAWPNDTLRLYSPALYNQPNRPWRISPTPERNRYQVSNGKRTYVLRRGNDYLLPLP